MTTTPFTGTTVDSSAVAQYLFNTEFNSVKWALMRKENQRVLDTLNRAEFIGLHIRHYVAGYRKTLHLTLADSRSFLRDYPDVAKPMIEMVILKIRRDFMAHEWYELMPRLDMAIKRIESLLTMM